MRKIIDKFKNDVRVKKAFSILTINGKARLYASSFTYFFLISMIPYLIIQFSMFKFFGADEQIYQAILFFFNFSNSDLFDYIKNFQFTPKNIAYSLIVIIVTIYIASKGIDVFFQISTEINNAYSMRAGFIKRKIISLVSFIILCTLFSLLITFSMFFDNFNKFIFRSFYLYVLCYVFLFIFIFALNYSFFIYSNRKSFLFPGVFFSTNIIYFFYNFYLFLLRQSRTNEKIYGQFYSIIMLLLVIYFSSYILFLGIKINSKN